MEYTNREEKNNGLFLAEREKDGVPFPEFTRPDVPDCSLRVSQDLTVSWGGGALCGDVQAFCEDFPQGKQREKGLAYCRKMSYNKEDFEGNPPGEGDFLVFPRKGGSGEKEMKRERD